MISFALAVLLFSFLIIGVDSMCGKITDLDQVYGKVQVVEKLFLLVVVMMIKPQPIHL